MKACTKCGVTQDDSKFQLCNGKPVGQCRQCKTAAMKKNRADRGIAVRKMSVIEGDQKLCMGCGLFHPTSEFSPSKRGLGGISAYCRSYANAAFKQPAEKVRERTARYRTKHRPRWLSLHRLNQFKRKAAIAATSDGTVTDEFLWELYSTPNCHYCQKKIPRDKRTADHMIPLIRGGLHSAANLVMACHQCNSTKSSKTLNEFQKLKEQS